MSATFTKLAPTVHLDMIYWYQVVVTLCPWPTFHAWVTMVRKKWLSIYYSTYWCYIHQTCTNCSPWHDLLMPRGGFCHWPTFHAWLTKTQNGNSRAPVMVPITIEFVATVPHRSCGYVDKLSDRKIVNISSVTRDSLHLAIQVLNNLSSQWENI